MELTIDVGRLQNRIAELLYLLKQVEDHLSLYKKQFNENPLVIHSEDQDILHKVGEWNELFGGFSVLLNLYSDQTGHEIDNDEEILAWLPTDRGDLH